MRCAVEFLFHCWFSLGASAVSQIHGLGVGDFGLGTHSLFWFEGRIANEATEGEISIAFSSTYCCSVNT